MFNIDEQQLNHPICENIDEKGNYREDHLKLSKIELNRLEKTINQTKVKI